MPRRKENHPIRKTRPPLLRKARNIMKKSPAERRGFFIIHIRTQSLSLPVLTAYCLLLTADFLRTRFPTRHVLEHFRG